MRAVGLLSAGSHRMIGSGWDLCGAAWLGWGLSATYLLLPLPISRGSRTYMLTYIKYLSPADPEPGSGRCGDMYRDCAASMGL